MDVCSDSQVDQFHNFWLSESSFWLSGAFGQAIGTPLDIKRRAGWMGSCSKSGYEN